MDMKNKHAITKLSDKSVILYKPNGNKYVLDKKGNNLFYYNYHFYVNEKRRIISIDIPYFRLDKYVANGTVVIVNEFVD